MKTNTSQIESFDESRLSQYSFLSRFLDQRRKVDEAVERCRKESPCKTPGCEKCGRIIRNRCSVETAESIFRASLTSTYMFCTFTSQRWSVDLPSIADESQLQYFASKEMIEPTVDDVTARVQENYHAVSMTFRYQIALIAQKLVDLGFRGKLIPEVAFVQPEREVERTVKLKFHFHAHLSIQPARQSSLSVRDERQNSSSTPVTWSASQILCLLRTQGSMLDDLRLHKSQTPSLLSKEDAKKLGAYCYSLNKIEEIDLSDQPGDSPKLFEGSREEQLRIIQAIHADGKLDAISLGEQPRLKEEDVFYSLLLTRRSRGMRLETHQRKAPRTSRLFRKYVNDAFQHFEKISLDNYKQLLSNFELDELVNSYSLRMATVDMSQPIRDPIDPTVRKSGTYSIELSEDPSDLTEPAKPEAIQFTRGQEQLLLRLRPVVRATEIMTDIIGLHALQKHLTSKHPHHELLKAVNATLLLLDKRFPTMLDANRFDRRFPRLYPNSPGAFASAWYWLIANIEAAITINHAKHRAKTTAVRKRIIAKNKKKAL